MLCDGNHISIFLLAWKLEPIDNVQFRRCHVSVHVGGPVQTNQMMLVHITPTEDCAHSGFCGGRPQADNCRQGLDWIGRRHDRAHVFIDRDFILLQQPMTSSVSQGIGMLDIFHFQTVLLVSFRTPGR